MNTTNHPITIKDIARKFKCSPSTVSRALSNHPLINEETRKNIQEYASKMGYQRNSLSVGLRHSKSGTLGVIVPTISHFHETAMVEGMQSVLQSRGYLMTICVTNESYALEKEYVEKLLANRVEGIFLSVSQETYDSGHYEHLESILQRHIPLIFIDREYDGVEASSLTVDDYLGAFTATEHLILRGCRRIAHLKGPNGLTVSERRFKGYKDCLEKYNIPFDEELIGHSNFKAESAVVPTRRLMSLPHPPDGIFGVNDYVSIAAMQVIIDMGFSIPGQVAVIGFDNSPFSAYFNPALSTVNRSSKLKEEFRNYDTPERDTVREFYRLNHTYQSYDFVKQKQAEFLKFDKKEMPIWTAFDFLNTLVDDSDPDTNLDQWQHLLQTSECIRADGHPDWFVLTGLMHDMGKVLCLFGEPQWAVVGDTFPVGCKPSDKIVYPEYFEANPDSKDERFNTKYGIYEPNCGLRNVDMSWGHDEYLYQMMKDYMPEEALYMMRYHSFYAQHREHAYEHLMDDHDREMFKWVKLFNPYDLYSKAPVPPDTEALKPYYQDLLAKYLPANLKF